MERGEEGKVSSTYFSLRTSDPTLNLIRIYNWFQGFIFACIFFCHGDETSLRFKTRVFVTFVPVFSYSVSCGNRSIVT